MFQPIIVKHSKIRKRNKLSHNLLKEMFKEGLPRHGLQSHGVTDREL